MRDIGKNIRELRVAKKITQEEFAERLFVTRQTLSNYENGKTRPDVDMIKKIAEVLEVDANTVFYGSPVSEDKKQEIKKMWIIIAVLTVLVIFAAIINPISIYLHKSFAYAGQFFVINCIFYPLLMIFAGWCVTNVLGIIFNFRPLNKKFSRKIFIVIISVLLAEAFFILPVTVWFCSLDIQQYFSPEITVMTSFSHILPVFNHISWRILEFNATAYAIYTAPGMLLWIFGYPKRHWQ